MPRTVKLDTNVNVFLKLLSLSLLFREQLSEGTRLMWLICRDAHPTLNRLGNVI